MSKGNTYRVKLKKPTPMQEKMQRLSSQFNFIIGGEQSGKTELAIDTLISSKNGILNGSNPVGWFSPTKEKLSEHKRQIKSIIDSLLIKQTTINKNELVTGVDLYFYSLDEIPKNLPQFGMIIVDDASDAVDFGDIFYDVLSESIREFSGAAWFFSRATSYASDVYTVFKAAKSDPSWSCWNMPTASNPNISEELKAVIGKVEGEEFEQRFLGEFTKTRITLTLAQRAIGHDESFRQWCERLAEDGLKVDGHPFRLDNRPSLIPIYEAIPTSKEDAKDLFLIIQKATQLGLTIWETLASIYMAIKWGPISIGMYMPAQKNAIDKSEHRFMRIVRSSPQLYGLLTTGTDIDGKDKKVGEGNVLTRRVQDSLLMFLWTTGKVTTESFPFDVVTLDETQEMTLEQIDKVRARTGDSDIQFTLMLSTANMDDQDINFWYRRGTQEVWHTECPHCKELSDLSDPNGNFPDKSIGYNNGSVKGVEANEYYWRCPECNEPIDDPQIGRYISANPGVSSKMRSFLLPRTISPKLTPRKMIEGWLNAKTGDQKKSFYNRTLARPYIDADQLPVSMSHCIAAAEEGVNMGLKWKTSGRHFVAGIDQMGSFNVMIIKERLPDGRQAVVHVEAIFNDSPFDRCSELMDVFGIDVCVVEQLPNVNDARRFANRHLGKVFLAGYADLRDDQMVWGDQLSRSDSRTSEEDRTRYTVTLNQYKCMQTALFRVKNRHCLFPDPDELVQEVIDNGMRKRIPILRDWVFFHFTKTALIVDFNDKEGARKPRAKVVKVGIDPHFSYANMLCDVAWARLYGTSTFILPDADQPQQRIIDNSATIPIRTASVMEEINALQYSGDVCGRCISFNPETKLCSEIDMSVNPRDPGCAGFVAS